MREFLKTNKTNKIILAAFFVFLASLVLHSAFNFNIPLYFSGFFLAIFVPGAAILNVLESKKNYLEKFFTAPVFTVFFFMPIYYLLTLATDRKTSFLLALISIVTISLCSFIFAKERVEEKEIADTHYLKFILLGIIAFLFVHSATILSYRFVPEIDGYLGIMKTEEILSSGRFDISYRPLFLLFTSYVSQISQIPPYWLFKFAIIIIQISGIYYLYQLTTLANIKQRTTKYLILLSFAAVPIINLEIDYVRPNILFILAVLPFIYYLSRGLEGKRKYLIFSSIISTAGLMIHEFFIGLFILNAFFIFGYFFRNLEYRKKLAIKLAGTVFFFIMLLNFERFSFLQLPINIVEDLLNMIQIGLSWSWWFLSGYSNMDGFDLGWTGFRNVLNYYAYSLSPFLALLFPFMLFFLMKKIFKKENFSATEKVSLSILIMGLVFAEFLPRLDFPTLPDRFWPMISISLIAISPFVFSGLKPLNTKLFRSIAAIFLLIGISGSVYIAKSKAGYVSDREYEAAIWIKENTPSDSIFITQGGNGAMLDYFARRKNIVPPNTFFLSGNMGERNDNKKSEKMLKTIEGLFAESLKNPTEKNLSLLEASLKKYDNERSREKFIESFENQEAVYVLYSFDKFNNYYANRQWWRESNFFGADLRKFNENYDLVYNNNDIIYIWKKK